MNFEKCGGLVPAIIQDVHTKIVLMLGYMNQEALEMTLKTKWVTFFSRSKNRLWTKGETSGNKLQFVSMTPDCDGDAILIHANPMNTVCHLDNFSCFSPVLNTVEKIIDDRYVNRKQESYVSNLFDSGINRIAQKVGEESVEVVISALEDNNAALCEEAADLLFHVLVLLRAKNVKFEEVENVLKMRVK